MSTFACSWVTRPFRVFLIPLWQGGIKGDFKIMLIKSPLAPLCIHSGGNKDAKEGYKATIVLL